MPSCLAIIVTYNPQLSVLQAQLQALESQVQMSLIVDNASFIEKESIQKLDSPKIHVHLMDDNQGLARAYNLGIDYAVKNGFSHVLLMDQDSVPAPDMLEKLLIAQQKLERNQTKYAALGANYCDSGNHRTYYINSDKCPVTRLYCEQEQLIACDHVISSGSLISLKTIQDIGQMDDGLFIDLVDIDWGLKAKSKGYYSYAVCDANMTHMIGEECHKIKLTNKRMNIHSALRYYYQFRNAFLVYRRDYANWCWIIYHFNRHIAFKFFYTLFFLPQRRKNVPMMLLGVYHGLLGKSGKFQSKDE